MKLPGAKGVYLLVLVVPPSGILGIIPTTKTSRQGVGGSSFFWLLRKPGVIRRHRNSSADCPSPRCANGAASTVGNTNPVDRIDRVRFAGDSDAFHHREKRFVTVFGKTETTSEERRLPPRACCPA
jgi:hypothetical protein